MCSIYASDIPDGVKGIADFDYFKEKLPPNSKGIYLIYILINGQPSVKYLGSAKDINSRLDCHAKNNVLVPDDKVKAIIFEASTGQNVIREHEKSLINLHAPPLNKHVGAPGRPWQCEQFFKLASFMKHNNASLTSEGKVVIQNILLGKKNVKLRGPLLKLMRLFK
jgi:hypothetical protein